MVQSTPTRSPNLAAPPKPAPWHRRRRAAHVAALLRRRLRLLGWCGLHTELNLVPALPGVVPVTQSDDLDGPVARRSGDRALEKSALLVDAELSVLDAELLPILLVSDLVLSGAV